MVKMWNWLTVIFLSAFGWGLSAPWALAASEMTVPDTLAKCGTATVAMVESGDTLVTTDGLYIQLAAIKAPELWPEGSAYASWPHAAWARDKLERTVKGKTVGLFCEGETTSFDDRKIAHIQLPGSEWLQDVLVRQGAAYVFPRSNHLAGLNRLYATEDAARNQGIGIWQTTSIVSADSEDIRTGWFQIVRGTVLNVAKVGGQTFLNFGTDWRKDFTAEIPASALRAFKKAEVDPSTFQLKQVEVRGWVTWKGGPHIMLEGPGQIRTVSP